MDNKHIKIGGYPVFFKHFFDVGIKFIGNLFIGNSPRESFHFWKEKGLEKNFFMKFISLRSAAYKQFKKLKFPVKNSQDLVNKSIYLTSTNGLSYKFGEIPKSNVSIAS